MLHCWRALGFSPESFREPRPKEPTRRSRIGSQWITANALRILRSEPHVRMGLRKINLELLRLKPDTATRITLRRVRRSLDSLESKGRIRRDVCDKYKTPTWYWAPDYAQNRQVSRENI